MQVVWPVFLQILITGNVDEGNLIKLPIAWRGNVLFPIESLILKPLMAERIVV